MSQNYVWPAPATTAPVGGATAANQVLEIAELTAINTNTAGLLTDAELRATPVPVSGTVSTGGLTDAELRASAVPVSLTSTTITGLVAVTGPLTDTELRATPVPVSGTVSTGGLTDAELRASPVAVTSSSLPLPTGAATAANQVLEIAELVDIVTSVQLLDDTVETHAGNSFIMVGGRHGPGAGAVKELAVDSAGQAQVDVVSSALPTGAATSANQTTANASLSSIDSKLTSPLAVTGPLTDAQLRASAVPVSASSLPLPTGAATEATLASFSTKSQAGLVPEAFDEQVITYVGATDRISTVVYKLATVTVATLTMSYDGSDRLDGVVKT